ncbi:MAG TPA: RsmD family RNA methyltransferase [candidate division Zixibacteria bacterium]|nr:RsmD family RNA methyltransferase [candidate division Zixibacteria bacterium]
MGKEDFKFQVIAGQLKGRTIVSPDLGLTRPPLTRIRRAIFDFLWPYLEDANYLDLFSGTGSYLFEAVSRGAKNSIGVEMERELVDAINLQASKFGVGDKLKCLCQDVFEAIPTLHKNKNQFDVLMIAPPQYQGLINKTLLCLKEFPVMTRGGMILCQHDTSEKNKIDFVGFEISEERKYGNSTFTILDYR